MFALKEKNVLVIGLGTSGQAACDLLLKRGARVTAVDSGDSETLRRVAYAEKRVPEALQAAMNAYTADAYLLNARDILTSLFWGNFDTENFPEARKWCAEGRRRSARSFSRIARSTGPARAFM